mmetsp:Transcript_4963/g.6820  ORF Transcript_4963/g.6820 Transcript_4963/m.6820 type:complete len:223 (-) Transcript_4963:698-1366(-)
MGSKKTLANSCRTKKSTRASHISTAVLPFSRLSSSAGHTAPRKSCCSSFSHRGHAHCPSGRSSSFSLRQGSRWKARGHESQHTRPPPVLQMEQNSILPSSGLASLSSPSSSWSSSSSSPSSEGKRTGRGGKGRGDSAFTATDPLGGAVMVAGRPGPPGSSCFTALLLPPPGVTAAKAVSAGGLGPAGESAGAGATTALIQLPVAVDMRPMSSLKFRPLQFAA